MSTRAASRTAFLAALLLGACAAPHYVRFRDGTVLAVSASLGEDSLYEKVAFQDGTRKFSAEKFGKNQSDTVQAVTTGVVSWKGLDVLSDQTHDTEVTDRTGIREGAATQRNADTIKGQTDQLKILNP